MATTSPVGTANLMPHKVITTEADYELYVADWKRIYNQHLGSLPIKQAQMLANGVAVAFKLVPCGSVSFSATCKLSAKRKKEIQRGV